MAGSAVNLFARETIASAERFLADLERHRPKAVRLAQHSSHFGIGGRAASAQALMTWAASPLRGELILPIDREALGEFAETFPGILSLSLPVALRSRGREAIEHTEAEKCLATELARLNTPLSAADLRSGQRIWLVCVDHLTLGAPEALYDGSSSAEPEPAEQKFSALATLFRNKLLEGAALPSGFLSTLAFCCFELFANTHDHARKGLRDEAAHHITPGAPSLSVRGIYAHRVQVDPRHIQKLAEGSAPLADYLTRRENTLRERKHLQFLEVSVFDTGPGYAARLKNLPLEQISQAEEIAAVGTCFAKHMGSKRRSDRGKGLTDTAAELIAAKGFFRLRTGRVNACAAMDLAGDPAAPPLVDWTGSAIAANHAPAIGTLFTFLLPLQRDEEHLQLPF